MTRRAVVVGATGAVGGALVKELLGSPQWSSVTALARRAVTTFDDAPGRDKLAFEVVNLDDLEQVTATLASGHDAAYNTMGIGQPRKVPFAEFHKVDVEYAGAFARGAARAGVKHISLLSSVGADHASRNRYLRTKGDAEQGTIAAGIARTSIFRPSVLVTRTIRYGMQDKLTQALFPMAAPLLPARFHQVTVEDLGRAMRLNAERGGPQTTEILYYPQFRSLLSGR